MNLLKKIQNIILFCSHQIYVNAKINISNYLKINNIIYNLIIITKQIVSILN